MEKIALFDPDVVILDADLRWGGAEGVLARLRDGAVSPRDPIVLVTGDTKPVQLSALLRLPADRCFKKPVSLDRLRDAIQSALFERSGRQPAVAGTK